MVKVEIKNCYGINNLEKEFNFTGGKSTQVIYAPNGVMKTSFANVFDDYSKGVESKDLIFPDKDSIRIIKDGEGNEIEPESIFVIRPYEKSFKSNKMSTLLVKEDLRKQYDDIHEKIDLEKEKLIQVLKVSTGLKINIEKNISEDFDDTPSNLLEVLSRLVEWVTDEGEPQYGQIIYNNIFNEKVLAFLETGDFKHQIKEYIEKYDELISESKIFKKGFNHYNADSINKSLKENGFFNANHSINLSINGEKEEITNQNTLSKVLKEAKEAILKDDTLQSIFNSIDKKISNAQLRDFRDYLFENQSILPELANLNAFKQKLWVSYFKVNIDIYLKLLEEYNKGQNEIKKILERAKSEETDWENVIDIFNSRFYVPYRIGIKNKVDSILKDMAPSIYYYFEDSTRNIDEDLLIRVLSQGEKRTLYLLNIVFEIESRKKQGLKTIYIIDDIADSFDYKNKYAIIEYLKEITDFSDFRSIILTHNFDFFRTIQERVSGNSKYQGSYMAIKEKDFIKLEELKYKYISNPLKNWKENLSDNAKLIASVTFARNIAEYTGDTENFNKLTSLLHVKEITRNLTINDLQEVYKRIFKDLSNLELNNRDEKIYDIIFEVANQIVNSESESEANLENKVVLSMAIRLKAEIYMIMMINDNEFVTRIKKNQTGKLFGEYKKRFSNYTSSIEVLEKVNIMTPENIHLNSFMFEPIIDLSDYHLKQLYKDVLQLLEHVELENLQEEVAASLEEN